jgi:hypothetical protein
MLAPRSSSRRVHDVPSMVGLCNFSHRSQACFQLLTPTQGHCRPARWALSPQFTCTEGPARVVIPAMACLASRRVGDHGEIKKCGHRSVMETAHESFHHVAMHQVRPRSNCCSSGTRCRQPTCGEEPRRGGRPVLTQGSQLSGAISRVHVRQHAHCHESDWLGYAPMLLACSDHSPAWWRYRAIPRHPHRTPHGPVSAGSNRRSAWKIYLQRWRHRTTT